VLNTNTGEKNNKRRYCLIPTREKKQQKEILLNTNTREKTTKEDTA
jgi:hypothetical protein